MHRKASENSKIRKLLLTRIGDLEIYFRRLLGLSLVEKYKYFLEYPDDFNSDEIKRIVYLIRGKKYKPAIFIHGVMPRSGTNYLADLLQRHKDVFSFTHHFWEFPLLAFTGNVEDLQSDFNRRISRYPGSLKSFEFSAYLNAGMMKNLQQLSDEPTKTMLFKFPFVHYLRLFRTLFPRDYLLLVLRDGRDVVASSLQTFGSGFLKKNFSDYCKEWDYATRCILKYAQGGTFQNSRTIVVKYEDVYQDPEKNIRRILGTLPLNAKRFDFQNIRNEPIRGSSSLRDKHGKVIWRPQEHPETFNPIGRWANWPSSLKSKFKKSAGQSLIAARYAEDYNW